MYPHSLVRVITVCLIKFLNPRLPTERSEDYDQTAGMCSVISADLTDTLSHGAVHVVYTHSRVSFVQPVMFGIKEILLE